jgi:gamma-glutamyltranspeptidase/glutathione hydrolase
VLQILGSLERFDMRAMGKDDPKSWYLIGQAMQLAYADREKYLGDSNSFVRGARRRPDRQSLSG